MMDISIPDDVRYIIDALETNGFEAYAVGGCVRDSLLGKEPDDWDICTSALPEQIKSCFFGEHIIETGLKHGTVTLMLGHVAYELTTYRTDGKYTDNRHPEKVKFVSVLKRDLARRDFTMNSLAYNPKTGLVDYYGGESDLANGMIKCVGNAEKRFQEDALRIMRALRFASSFGFSIEENTAKAMRENKKLLRNISAERIAAELNKLVLGEGAKNIISEHMEIIKEIIPEYSSAIGIEFAPKDISIRLAAFFGDICAESAKKILMGLKYDNETAKAVTQLLLLRDFEITDGKDIKRQLRKIGEKRLRQLIELKRSYAIAEARNDKLGALDELLESLNEIIRQKQCFSLKDLAVNGKDLIEIGVSEGSEIGIALNGLLDMVIEEKAKNDREALLAIAKKRLSEAKTQ